MRYWKRLKIFTATREGGFSLVGSIVAAGMMSGLALVLASLSKQQNIVQKNTETYFETTALFNSISRTLHDGEACKKTLGVGNSVNDGRNIDFIKNKGGGNIFNTTDKYGNGLVQIDLMTLKNPFITGTSGSVELEVILSKLNNAIKGYKKATKVFPLTVEVDSSNNLLKCHHTIDDLLQTVSDVATNQMEPLLETKLDALRQEICTAAGANYDATAKRCTP